MAQIVGLSILSVVSSSALMFFIVAFTKTMSAFSTLSTIIGTVIGFLTGIYIPIGVLPAAVQSIIKLVPASYSAALMRQLFMAEPLQQVFGQAPASCRQAFRREMGVDLFIGSREVSPATTLAIMALSGVLFFVLSAVVMSRRKQR